MVAVAVARQAPVCHGERDATQHAAAVLPALPWPTRPLPPALHLLLRLLLPLLDPSGAWGRPLLLRWATP